MKTKSFVQMGSLHPVLFFALIYAVALLLSIFICSSLFYSCNATARESADLQVVAPKNAAMTIAAVNK
jgi:hypothetical protein